SDSATSSRTFTWPFVSFRWICNKVFRSLHFAAFATSGSSRSAICISPSLFRKFLGTLLGTLVLVVCFALMCPRGTPGRETFGRPLDDFVTNPIPSVPWLLPDRIPPGFSVTSPLHKLLLDLLPIKNNAFRVARGRRRSNSPRPPQIST